MTDQPVIASLNEGSVPPGLLEALARAVVAVLSPSPNPLPDGGVLSGTLDAHEVAGFRHCVCR